MAVIILILFFVLLIISTLALFDIIKDEYHVDYFLACYACGTIAVSLCGIVVYIIRFLM